MVNKITITAAFLAVMLSMTGIAVAPGEGFSATWTGTQIVTNAWNFLIPASGPQWYQVRYYPPGEFDPANPEAGTFFTNPPFAGLATYTQDAPYTESFTPGPVIQGTWVVALFKDGTITAPPEEIISLRVYREVPIPEFPTLALPVAAVIGLVFFFQHRKKKEE